MLLAVLLDHQHIYCTIRKKPFLSIQKDLQQKIIVLNCFSGNSNKYATAIKYMLYPHLEALSTQ